MAHIKGIDFVLYANTGTEDSPTWTKIGGQRGATLNRSAETLETTTKDSEGYKEFETSFKEWSIEAEGLLVTDDVSFEQLETHFNENRKMRVQLRTNDEEAYSGDVIITDLPIEMSYDDLASYSVTLQGSGVLDRVPTTETL